MPKDTPARTSPEIDFLRRMRARNAAYAGAAFLDEAELADIDVLLSDAVTRGVTPMIARRAHAQLVVLQERDSQWQFLDFESRRASDTERRELALLINPSSKTVAPEHAVSTSVSPAHSQNMRAGELLATAGVVLSVAAAALLTYRNPGSSDWAGWVAFWGFIYGSGLISDTRKRSVKRGGAASAHEGIAVALIWAVATVVIVVFGGTYGHGHDAAWAAFFGFMAAAGMSRSSLRLKD